MANKMKLKINDQMKICEHCDMGKMKKKNISKTTLERAEKPGERVYMDISSIKYTSAGGAKFWGLFVDDSTDFLFGIYLKKKLDLATEGMKLIKSIENNYQVTIKRIRCENGGIEGDLRKNLWAEAGNTAINLMNIQVSSTDHKSPYEKFCDKQGLPKYAKTWYHSEKLE